MRSCSLPLSAVEGKSVTTIEGLSPDGGHPLQKAWVAGAGEDGQPLVAGAVGNAIAALTGVRLRELPFDPDRIRQALRS